MGGRTPGPLSSRNEAGDRTPQPPARQPRLIRAGRSRRWRPAAGEKGAGRRGRRLPVGARTKPQLRLLCPFQTAFVPITSGPAAIWAEAARTARGPRPSLVCRLAAGRGRPHLRPFRTQIRFSEPFPSLSGENGICSLKKKKVTGEGFSHSLSCLQGAPPDTTPHFGQISGFGEERGRRAVVRGEGV